MLKDYLLKGHVINHRLEKVENDVFQIKEKVNEKTGDERNFRLVVDYNIPNVSDKVVRIILGYTDYIKRTAWSE